jgi:hypothetical protein
MIFGTNIPNNFQNSFLKNVAGRVSAFVSGETGVIWASRPPVCGGRPERTTF